MPLSDYAIGDAITAFLAVRRLQRREYNGNPYLTMNLADQSMSIDAVMWEGFAPVVDKLRPGVVVKVQGIISEYREKPQLRLERLRLAEGSEYDVADLLPASEVPTDELADGLTSTIAEITDTHLRQLLERIFNEPDILEAFLLTPGGQRWHHASVGGLAEHTLSMVQLCRHVAAHYPELNRDLLIAGALLHDIGKIKQYATTAVFEYTDSGRLLGHIVEGDEIIAGAIKDIDGFPEELAMQLRHLVLAHHGAVERGSPIPPQTREAFALYYIDELDAKMGALRKIADKTGEEPWSEYVRLLERFIYFGHPASSAPADEEE